MMTPSDHYQSGPPLPPVPDFREFYEAINGRAPFPWQARLAREVAERRRWPDEIGVPTGLGKTACLDIAIWWLALEADNPPAERHAPTRIWWVVNRRLLVDSTAEHAEYLAEALACPDMLANNDAARVVALVAARLFSDFEAPPLDVIRLRGGVASQSPKDPSRPTIVLCTVPMYGSRLLFRGYGSRMRSVDAAMAGTDSLVLLDEAHLAPHLKRLLPALAECAPATREVLAGSRSRPCLVSLTATGDAHEEKRFDLDEGDLAHPLVRQRLDAPKPLELRCHSSGKAAAHLADATCELIEAAEKPASFLVFANTPKTARDTFQRLRKATAGTGAELLLLTGRVREREAQRIRTRLMDPSNGMAAVRNEGAVRENHLVVVATQTLEVGADLDAEYLVTEQCGVRALTQRLGRMNRLGRRRDARAVYLHMPPSAESNTDWPVYGEEPKTVLERLREACDKDDFVNLSPGLVANVLGAPCDDPGRAPQIMPEILWEWTKTTTPPEGEAPVEPYFSGIAGPEYTVSLIWRNHVPTVEDDAAERLWPRATDREAIQIPISDAREALKDDNKLCRLVDGVTLEWISIGDLRPGDCIVLRSDRGLMDEYGWNQEAEKPVIDVSLMERGLPLDADAIERLCGVTGLDGFIDTALGEAEEGEEIEPADRIDAAKEILEALRNAQHPPGWYDGEWTHFVDSLLPEVITAPGEIAHLSVRKPAGDQPIDNLDECSAGHNKIVTLDRHCRDVADLAGVIAQNIGLADELVDAVACAGMLHDVGKGDRRFQHWLDPQGEHTVPIAKSNTPRHRWEAGRRGSGWPRGGRHEALSARLVCAWLETKPEPPVNDDLRDLLVHLVISHHGKARPLLRPVSDDTDMEVMVEVPGMAVEKPFWYDHYPHPRQLVTTEGTATRIKAPANLSIVDWDQPGRFRRLNERFGPWGLSLLEAIVIGADHAVSGGNATATEGTGSEEAR